MNLTIPDLALVVLVGASGSGKSTFARRHFKPTEVLSSDVCRGLVSDDTDHHVFVAQALLVARGDVDAFRRELTRRLRLWLICLPAGIGSATLRGLLRAWLGLRHSGVHSAGNGPSMRSALLGCMFAGDAAARRAHVAAATSITHLDPRAFAGAPTS